jgi:DNA-binding GntR family transcriptional regulator
MRNVENNSPEINSESRGLLKENLAVQLREAILAGKILPGEKIIEGRWARQFGVAQVSIREALNILTTEGFVTKGHGRSARVLKLGDPEIIQIYQLRGALEGLAARLVVEQKLPLDDLEAALGKSRMIFVKWWIESNNFIFVCSKRLVTPFFQTPAGE